MFSEFFSLEHEKNLLKTLCDDEVTYCGQPIDAVVDYNQQSVAIQDSYATAPQITILTLKEYVPNIKRGSVFTHLGKKLVVDQVMQKTAVHILASVNYANNKTS